MRVEEADFARVSAAIELAEAQTSGEIMCVLDRDRHVYRGWVLGLAALSAFLFPFLATMAGFGPAEVLALFGAQDWLSGEEGISERRLIETYAAVQLGLFLILVFLIQRTPLAQRYAPLWMRRERVHELALKQFLAHGIHLTEARTGVLIFVSLHDHMTEIVADEGIYAKVSSDVWREADAALLEGLARGDVAGGFKAAIDRVGSVLAEHFPPAESNRDELPNRLIAL
jgi:putative membrane protein